MKISGPFKECHLYLQSSVRSVQTSRLLIWPFSHRWFRNLGHGGLCATPVTRKATFLRMFWSQWTTLDLWRIDRWAKRNLALLRLAVQDFLHVCSLQSASQWDSRGPVTLNMNSSPAEVKAWLEYKGFSRMWEQISNFKMFILLVKHVLLGVIDLL